MLAMIVLIATGVFRVLRPILEEFSASAGEGMKNRLSKGLHRITLGR